MDTSEDRASAIIRAWQQERPDLDTSSVGVVTRIWELSRFFDNQRRRLLADLNIDSALLDLLGTLRRSGSPYSLSTREIASRAAVTPSAVSQRLTRAEERGWVRREEIPGRTVMVHLTSQGQQLIDDTAGEIFAMENRLLSKMTPKQREDLSDLLKNLCIECMTVNNT